MITLSRRETTWDIIKEFHGGELKYNEWDKLRDYIYINSEERKHEEKTVSSDDYSIINCCGDFQLAHKNVWNGNVENMILQKSNPFFYNDPIVKCGYCRGQETYLYVKEILNRYHHYKTMPEASASIACK